MTNYPTMGDLWPRQGFSSINADQCALWMQALAKAKEKSPISDVTNADLFATHCNTWTHGQHDGDTIKAIMSAVPYMRPSPAIEHLSVCNIHCDLMRMRVTDLTSHQAIWRWPYYQFAYSIYWALLFHESNAMLENPDFLSQKILRLWACFYNKVDELSLHDRKMHLQKLVAALFERTLGAQTDIREKRQCFIHNIADRRELGRREKIRRVRAFTQAIEFLLNKWQGMMLIVPPQ